MPAYLRLAFILICLVSGAACALYWNGSYVVGLAVWSAVFAVALAGLLRLGTGRWF